MKTHLIICIIASGLCINAQTTCSNFVLTKGSILEFEMKNYPLAFEINKDWFSLNDKKKEKEAAQINADMASGKIASKTVQPMFITVNDMQTEDGKNTLLSRFTMANTDIGIKFQCSGDTIYSYYANGVPYPVIYKGDTLGTSVFGVRKYPLNPQIGGYLPGMINDTYMVPQESMSTVRTSFNIPRGNYTYHGFVTMKQKMKITSSTTMIYFPSLVIGKEDFVVVGKTYTAYKLATIMWFKATSTVEKTEDPETYFNDRSLSDEIKANQKGFEEKVQKKTQRKIDKYSGANDKGYIESMEENWYVPELACFVKTIHYDKDGIVQFITTLKSIK